MSVHAQLVFAAWLTCICVFGVMAFAVWLAVEFVRGLLYRFRIRRNIRHFDARVGRDCWRDIKGVTK
jgi:hypothetical protein